MPELSSSLGYWGSFPLVEGEHREDNADDHAGVSAIEIQRDAQLERETAVRRLALNTAGAAYANAGTEMDLLEGIGPAAPAEPNIRLTPRSVLWPQLRACASLPEMGSQKLRQ